MRHEHHDAHEHEHDEEEPGCGEVATNPGYETRPTTE